MALVAVSCQIDPTFERPVDSDQGMILKFSCGDMITKAPVDGDTNENLIKRIDYFFFPVNSEGKVEDSAECVYRNELIPTDNGLAKEYTVVFQPGVLSEIFPDGATTAVVAAVANYCERDTTTGVVSVIPVPDSISTWKALHELEVGATFFKDGGPGFVMRWPRVMQPDDDDLFFVMAADSVAIQLHTNGSFAVDAEIPLERLASKITVDFTYENYVEEFENGNVTWVPQPGDAETRVYVSNAIEHTTIGGPLTRDLVPDGWGTATRPTGKGTRDVFEYAYDFMVDIPEVDGKKTAHYYTYPIQMEEGNDNQPYIKLVLLWYGYKNYGEANQILYKQKEVYYKIALPSAYIDEPNKIYQYSVNVNIIGSDKEVSIQSDYVVKSWLSGDPVSSNVATGRYISLDIPKDHYDMYVDSIDIAFVSSGKVIAHIDSIYQLNLSGSTPQPDMFMRNDAVVASSTLRTKKGIATGTAGDNVIKSWVTIPNETSYLRINHKMDNTLMNGTTANTKFDMSPYVYRVTLHLEAAGTDTSFDRTVWITQYPSMYATSIKSNGKVFVNTYSYDNYAESSNSNHWAWNNSTSTQDNNRRIGTIVDPSGVNGSGTNNSQYSIIIHPTVLDEKLGLYIGEAREATGGSVQNINGLSNYRAGRGDDAAKSVVSPGFMIASSYGKTQPLASFARANERCATYQENGYPAGRWRIPTEGEIKYLIQLSDAGFIPSLFNARYYKSDGGYYESSGSTSESIYVRCVYDTWYWGEEPVATGTAANEWLGFYDNK